MWKTRRKEKSKRKKMGDYSKTNKGEDEFKRVEVERKGALN